MNTAELSILQLTPTENLYILVLWPDVQDLMNYNWFRSECLLHNALEEQDYLSSAYFVPVERMLEVHSGDMTNYDGEHQDFLPA